MTDEPLHPERGAEVLTALPRSRPHRRSTKRPAQPTPAGHAEAPAATTVLDPPVKPVARRPTAPTPAKRPRRRAGTGSSPPRLHQPPQPRGLPPQPETIARSEQDSPLSTGGGILGTAVQAAAELTEIGLTLSARMLRRAVSRLPRP